MNQSPEPIANKDSEWDEHYILSNILNFEHNESNDVVEMYDGNEYVIVPHKIWKPMVDNVLTYVHQQRKKAVRGALDRVNKATFFSKANPDGQHVKDCIFAEFERLDKGEA